MKKKLLTAALLTFCAIALVVSSVLTTIALLTSSTGVSNVFTVGNISIDMKESKVNSDGQLVDKNGRVIDADGYVINADDTRGESSERVKVDTNSYHLLPGKTYIKDPTIYITSETDKMFLFVKSANLIRRAEAGNYDDRTASTPLSMREQMESYGWVEFIRSGDGTEIVWVYGKRDIATGSIIPTPVTKITKQLKKGDVDAGLPEGQFRLCDNFTVHEDVDVSVYGAAHVTFTAFAIQTTGFGTGNETGHALTQAAWNAVKESFPYQCGIVNPINPYDKTLTNDRAYDAVKNKEKPEFELLPAPVKQNTSNP